MILPLIPLVALAATITPPKEELPRVLTRAEVEAIVAQVGLPSIFTDIAYCESGWNKYAIRHNTDKHKSVDRGLFQINDFWWADRLKSKAIIVTVEDLFDPIKNAKSAKVIFGSQGLEAWNASRHCWGRKGTKKWN